jgi:hypothetical protein
MRFSSTILAVILVAAPAAAAGCACDRLPVKAAPQCPNCPEEEGQKDRTCTCDQFCAQGNNAILELPAQADAPISFVVEAVETEEPCAFPEYVLTGEHLPPRSIQSIHLLLCTLLC